MPGKSVYRSEKQQGCSPWAPVSLLWLLSAMVWPFWSECNTPWAAHWITLDPSARFWAQRHNDYT